MKTFKLPDLGEGLPDAIIIKWHVKEGQEIDIDQPLVTVESAKASVEIPSSFKGKVIKLFGKSGETILTKAPLIGYEGKSYIDKEKKCAGIVGDIKVSEKILENVSLSSSQSNKKHISPDARALARKLKVDLDQIKIESEWITAEDIRKIASQNPSVHKKVRLSGTRLAMAYKMLSSQKEVVPVTCSYDADLNQWEENQGISVRILRAIVIACQKVPILNVSFHFAEKSYSMNKNVNIGVAIDTEDGTYIPVLKHAQTLSLTDMKEWLEEYKVKAREKNLSQEECSEATILLSNFGTLGANFATPIVIPPMVAIVGVGKITMKINTGGFFKALPLVLTSNHLLITGGEASRFIMTMAQDLEKSN